MRRGEVWWADLEPTRGGEINKVRPVLILSDDRLNRARSTVVAVPLTNGGRANTPLVVPVPSAGPNSKVVCDQVRALDKSRLQRRRGDLSEEDLEQVEAAMRLILRL